MITSADIAQDATPVDKYESLELRVSSIQQENKLLLASYQYVSFVCSILLLLFICLVDEMTNQVWGFSSKQ